MTIRKMWLIILIVMAIAAVVINAVILSLLTDRYFKNYLTENYDTHISEITEYSKNVLLEKGFSQAQAAMELETHLDDPITRIKLYDSGGNTIVDVSVDERQPMGRMMGNMMNFKYESSDSETDSVEIYDGNVFLGQLNITRYSSVEDSIATRMFKTSLLYNSLYSVAIVLVIAIITGIVISRRMSRALTSTAQMAQNIELGTQTDIEETNIREISTIQQSLETLAARLKLKNKSRKVLIDELVHQTRTPLTVLKTHLEGFSDKVIEMSPQEIKVCETQVDNITAIISNMSSIIDAGEDIEKVSPTQFEITGLMRQIVNGLKAQFDNKNIEMELDLREKEEIFSDRHKLSQSVYNILTNAYKYTKQGGRVKVSEESDELMVSITIEDNGVGIDEKDIDKIFDAYYRSSSGNRTEGDGLGLYIARENIEKINGNIRVESKKGNGSKFTITVPKKYEKERDV